MSYVSPFAPPYASASTADLVVVAPSKATPTSEDWERHRPLIKRLYVDEGMKLKDVVAIMTSQHGYNATSICQSHACNHSQLTYCSLKMYKDRIKKWRLDKKNKECDMLAILRKKTEREAVGKSSSFRVRGQPVAIEDVYHYFQRKKNMRDQEACNAPTPSDVSCRTPSPAPTVPTFENDIQMITTNPFSWPDQFAQPEGAQYANATENLDDTEIDCMVVSTPERTFSEYNEQILQCTLRDMYNLISDNGDIPRSPSTPQTLLIPERLLLTIKTYVNGSFEQGSWITGEDGYCTIPGIRPNSPFEFHDYCVSAVYLLERGLLVEFRRMLSKAFSVVDTLIRIQHPRTLDCIIDSVLYLRFRECHDIVELLLGYLSRISVILLTKDCPFGRILRLISMLEIDSLEQGLTEAWRCALNGFEKALGGLRTTSLDINLNFVLRVYGHLSHSVAEAHLRRLLAQTEKESRISKPTLDVMVSLAWNLYDQNKFAVAGQIGLDILSEAGGKGWYGLETGALELLARSQHQQDNKSSAEKNLRQSIQCTCETWGMADPLTIGRMIVLLEWLREWGREEEADQLQAEITEATGRDDIDEELEEELNGH
jgi:Clr5 domain